MKRRNFIATGFTAIVGAFLPIRNVVVPPPQRKICMWAGDPLGDLCFAYLDGNQVQHCRMADEERGEVVLYASDEDGYLRPITDLITRETEPALINLQGGVEIRLQEDAPQWARAEYLKLRAG